MPADMVFDNDVNPVLSKTEYNSLKKALEKLSKATKITIN